MPGIGMAPGGSSRAVVRNAKVGKDTTPACLEYSASVMRRASEIAAFIASMHRPPSCAPTMTSSASDPSQMEFFEQFEHLNLRTRRFNAPRTRLVTSGVLFFGNLLP